MTLYTTDYLEYYLTLVAWVVNNGIWSILVASGVFALPFVAIVIQEWLKARSEGADEGNKGVLSSMRIENRVWVAIVVIMFAGILYGAMYGGSTTSILLNTPGESGAIMTALEGNRMARSGRGAAAPGWRESPRARPGAPQRGDNTRCAASHCLLTGG